jgi:RimJ/RimL family protein N-acetyltransferase
VYKRQLCILGTRRLVLRPPTIDDAVAIMDLVGDAEVARNLARVPHPYSLSDARHFLEEIVPREIVWAIETSGRLVGMAGLSPEAEGEAELGYWIGRPFWGRGYATEAATAVVATGFADHGLHALTAGWFDDNPASGRVLAKLGFVPAGEGLRHCLAEGRDKRTFLMRLDAPGADRL